MEYFEDFHFLGEVFHVVHTHSVHFLQLFHLMDLGLELNLEDSFSSLGIFKFKHLLLLISLHFLDSPLHVIILSFDLVDSFK